MVFHPFRQRCSTSFRKALGTGGVPWSGLGGPGDIVHPEGGQSTSHDWNEIVARWKSYGGAGPQSGSARALAAAKEWLCAECLTWDAKGTGRYSSPALGRTAGSEAEFSASKDVATWSVGCDLRG